MYTVKLAAAGSESKSRIGSKALQLAKLSELHVAVPGGFVVTSEALSLFLTQNSLLFGHMEDNVEQRFSRAALPEEVWREVASAFEWLYEGECNDAPIAVAVRSSSSAEDLEAASFAGQYETILNVTSLAHLMESLKRCWASLFSSRVRAYALQNDLKWDAAGLPMGVLVQRMVQADVSGVIFSINPVTQNRDEIVINASYGLGEAVVSGLVTPDAFYVNKTDGHIVRELGLKELKIVAKDKETVEAETTEEEQNRFCLNDAQITELVRQTTAIEAFFARPVDIEFAVKDSRVYILQARPVTG
ncbi:PEP/pyruvate-binding domain-containing protein [Paenibacillus thalictri]|uniref:Pyruvate-binding protein n=1 Tax=Paenibacillus thalictri TaxID=2527873 RepID=A0A4Q9DHR8_9BACL|nr:PEP/pyruvate-binding domain-containing protein [Paenibacillus thalictri]TBL72453.1 pyruvate-binding protein [Paenibacillus thalictri]